MDSKTHFELIRLGLDPGDIFVEEIHYTTTPFDSLDVEQIEQTTETLVSVDTLQLAIEEYEESVRLKSIKKESRIVKFFKSMFKLA
jgi:hypothetical protein